LFGLSELNRRLHVARAAVEKVEELAGGSTTPGRVWSEGLAKDASKEAILEAFGTSGLEAANEENKTTNEIDNMETAFIEHMLVCACADQAHVLVDFVASCGTSCTPEVCACVCQRTCFLPMLPY
jgi:hypothetical protein